jgi:biopolymer transport protein ExbB
MTRLSNRTFLTLCVAIMAVSSAAPVFAQEGGAAEHEVTLVGMFLNPPDMLAKILIWFTIALSVYSFSQILRHGLNARKTVIMPAATVEEVERLLAERKYKEVLDMCNTDTSVFAKTMGAALGNAVHGFGAMRESAEEISFTSSATRIRGMEILNILGAAGPMIGLFGTVYGMIMSFYNMAKSGGAPKPAELAGGISAALVSTFWGLIVAIPAVLAYGMLRVQIENNVEEAFAKVMDLIKPFRPVPTKR